MSKTTAEIKQIIKDKEKFEAIKKKKLQELADKKQIKK